MVSKMSEFTVCWLGFAWLAAYWGMTKCTFTCQKVIMNFSWLIIKFNSDIFFSGKTYFSRQSTQLQTYRSLKLVLVSSLLTPLWITRNKELYAYVSAYIWAPLIPHFIIYDDNNGKTLLDASTDVECSSFWCTKQK